MSCPQYQERLTELLYDALEPGDAATVRSHIATCPDCRAEWQQLEATVALLDKAMPEPPRGMFDRAMAAIQREPIARLSWWTRVDLWIQSISRHRPTRASWAVASLLTLVLLVPVLYPNEVRFHSEGASAACRTNLRVLATALDRYADDHHGTYPGSLDELVPGYVRRLPRCPVAGVDTYLAGYVLSPDKLSFHLECSGHYHGAVAPYATPYPK